MRIRSPNPKSNIPTSIARKDVDICTQSMIPYGLFSLRLMVLRGGL